MGRYLQKESVNFLDTPFAKRKAETYGGIKRFYRIDNTKFGINIIMYALTS